ncbi:MAG: DUF4136 domain-containing protein [Acidiferrobacterales bacterium]
MSQNRIVLALVIVALTMCSARVQVKSEHDPEANFTDLKTYSWLPGTRKGGAVVGVIRNEFAHATVRSAVETQFARKGYELKFSGTPDFYVRYYAALRSRLVVQTSYAPAGTGRDTLTATAVSPPQRHVAEFNEGTLVLDVVNPKTNKLMWRGTAKTKINVDASDRKQESRINKAARRLLERFPPTPSGGSG